MKRVFFISIFSGCIFLSSILFSSAYFTRFLISSESADFNISALETVQSNIIVSVNPSSDNFVEKVSSYKISRKTICNQYDENWNCIDDLADLCPYISLEPKNEEVTEIGFPLNPQFPFDNATGELNLPIDETDNWTLKITSPCFENECPAGYNSYVNGNPLPQTLKGQTFKCDLRVESAYPPVLTKIIKGQNIAYADTTTSNTITISAVFTGSKAVQTIDPVVIIPGIMGSAYKNGKLLIDPILHTYDDLIATLKANGYIEGKDLFTFPYEWRDSNVLSANLLKDKINEVKTICNCSKVDLVAHSMGGLVAREYIEHGNYQNDIDQLIFLGTPHRGAPEAYLEWEAGKFAPDVLSQIIQLKFSVEALQNLYPSLFDYIHERQISSVQELLPTFDYLKDKDTGILRTYPNNYPKNIFLEALNNNTGIQKLLNSGVKITNIVGDTENNTIEKIRVVAGSNPLWIDGKPDGFDGSTSDHGLERGGGDGTVTTLGTILDTSILNEVASATDHISLPSKKDEDIFKILTGNITTTSFHSNLIEKLFTIQLHSPIDIVVTDPNGKRVGKDFSTGNEFNEIVGAFYSGYNNNDDEYITIPNPLDGNYKIEVQGTGNGGKYGVLTSYISDNFATATETTGVTKPNQITELDTVINNSNPQNLKTERIITPEVLINDINGAYDLGWIKDIKIKDALIKQVNGAIKFNKKIDIIKERQQDGSIKEKRVERFEIKVNKILVQLFTLELKTLLKKKMITQDAFNFIKNDIEYLINN
jgi:pimeloyl-ACP methyl ester carboxylesterase